MPIFADGGLQLYLEHRSALLAYAQPLVGSAWAEDVLQDAYLKFAPAAAKGKLHSPLSYLYRVVRNAAFDVRRSLKIEAARIDPDGVTDNIPAAVTTPERQTESRQSLQAVRQALDELPPRTRAAFDLCRFDGLTLAEAAGRLGISVTLTHRLVHDAMLHCAERLATLDSENPRGVVQRAKTQAAPATNRKLREQKRLGGSDGTGGFAAPTSIL